MRRSAVEEYLNPTGAPRRAPPSVPSWAEQVQQEGLRDYTIPEVRQAYGRTSAEFRQQEAQRVAANSADDREFMNAYRSRFGVNPQSTFRSAAAPQEDQGRRVPQPYAGVGVGAREDPGGGGGEEREQQPYAGVGVGAREDPYAGMPPPPGGGGDEWDEANYPPAGTGPPRGPGGAPQAPPPPPQAAPAPFQNADENIEANAGYRQTGYVPGLSAPVEHPFIPQRIPPGILPAPFDSPESILATFGENPNKKQLTRIIGLQFHPDKTGNPDLYQYVINAVNNAYGRDLIGSGKRRRKYRYYR